SSTSLGSKNLPTGASRAMAATGAGGGGATTAAGGSFAGARVAATCRLDGFGWSSAGRATVVGFGRADAATCGGAGVDARPSAVVSERVRADVERTLATG